MKIADILRKKDYLEYFKTNQNEERKKDYLEYLKTNQNEGKISFDFLNENALKNIDFETQKRLDFASEIKEIKNNVWQKRIGDRKKKFRDSAIPLIKEQIRKDAKILTSTDITVDFVQEHQEPTNPLFRDEIIEILREEFPSFKIIIRDCSPSICTISWDNF